ncbi:MAG: hypothetical protein R3F60_04090 [bacterium]
MEAGGFDARLGARPMRQTIGREVESRIARGILAGAIRPGDHLVVDAADDGLVVTPQPA